MQTRAHAVRLPVVESGECVHRSVGPTRICAGNVGRLSLLLSFTPDVRADEQSMAERGIWNCSNITSTVSLSFIFDLDLEVFGGENNKISQFHAAK